MLHICFAFFIVGSPEAGYASDEEQRKTAEALLHLAGMPPSPSPIPQVHMRNTAYYRALKHILLIYFTD